MIIDSFQTDFEIGSVHSSFCASHGPSVWQSSNQRWSSSTLISEKSSFSFEPSITSRDSKPLLQSRSNHAYVFNLCTGGGVSSPSCPIHATNLHPLTNIWTWYSTPHVTRVSRIIAVVAGSDTIYKSRNTRDLLLFHSGCRKLNGQISYIVKLMGEKKKNSV